MQGFDIASATIIGRDHVGTASLLKGRSNQDGLATAYGEHFVFAAVTDGCSAGAQSEIGARIGARLVQRIIERRLKRITSLNTGEEFRRFWEMVRKDLLSQIHSLALSMSGDESFTDTVGEYFLFSLICVLMTEETTHIVSIGDGVFAVNGEVSTIGPYPSNRPPYIAYDMIDSEFRDSPELLRFRVEQSLPTAEVDSLLIGTDGVTALVEAAHRMVPGRPDRVGPLSQFWEDDRYFRNRDAIRRKLALINSEALERASDGSPVLQGGLLPDDTTFVVIRRTPEVTVPCHER